MAENQIYYGDNLDVLRRYVADESVDLVYLDPPFNSNADYNVLFAEADGNRAASQIKAFKDTWQWDQASAHAYEEFVVTAPHAASLALQSFRSLLGCNDMLAYLSMMAPRLVELRRVLKPTGSLYLHCDPTASHYLKLFLDSLLGPKRFLNDICWKRSSAHSDTKQGMRRCGRIRDLILVYTKSDAHTWNPRYTNYSENYSSSNFKYVDENGKRFADENLTAAKPGGDTSYEWRVKKRIVSDSRWEADLSDEYLNPVEGYEYKGVTPYDGRFWAYSKDNLIRFEGEGLLYYRSTGMPRLKLYAHEMSGITLQDLWTDIPPELGKKSLGYPTQKPEALLERIVKASSNEGDVVLDPFCGCGTAIAVAHRLKRKWIGVDITHLAIGLIKTRLRDAHGPHIVTLYEVVGEPGSLPDAKALAAEDRYQFQYWALGLIGARPIPSEQKKGADKGIDGRMFFHDDKETGKTKQVIFSVKSGHLKTEYVRELPHILDRETAQIGVLVSLESPTKPMRSEAAAAGFYESPWNTRHPRIQILTVQDLLEGKQLDLPLFRENRTVKKAPKAKKPDAFKSSGLFETVEEDEP